MMIPHLLILLVCTVELKTRKITEFKMKISNYLQIVIKVVVKSHCDPNLGRSIDIIIIESVDSISKDERGFPLTQYITNGRISRDGYIFTHFKHHHHVLRLISYSMSV